MTLAEEEQIDGIVGTADRVMQRDNSVLRMSEEEAAALSLSPAD